MKNAGLLISALMIALAACATPLPVLPTGPLTNADFDERLGVDLEAMTQTSSGLRYQDLTVGMSDEATPLKRVEVHYEGWLINADKFDSSRDRGETFAFSLGRGEVIKGWDEGVEGMRVGGIRKLVIPPELAYGSEGIPGAIPRDATLVFDVELVAVGP